ncbi:MAG: hypothetical protein H6741_10585 [Alphaproteobacteria bacterium]|nr:hypothetical protein [Alphaproteobacteria bacterium]
MWLLLALACSEAEVPLHVQNPHAPLPLVVQLGGEELTRGAEAEWELSIRPSRLDPAHESLGLEASVMGPDGPRRVPASAVQRVSDDSVVLLPQRYGGAGLHLCVDNRGGPAASLSLGALTLSLPADATLALPRALPPETPDSASLRLGDAPLGRLPLAAELGEAQAVLVVDPSARRRYEARRVRYSASPIPQIDLFPDAERWGAEALHRVQLPLTALEEVDCLGASPEVKERPGDRVEVRGVD